MIENIMYNERAVIIITVYDRKEHLRKCLESLEKATDSELYHVIIGADAHFRLDDFEKIQDVRNYLRNKEVDHKFAKISVIYSDENLGQTENFERCHKLAKLYGHQAFIAMEDDIIVGKYFLKYMHEGLLKTKDEANIISVNAFLEADWNVNINKPFLTNRFNAYGYGCWYEKWDLLQFKRYNNNYAKKIIKDKFAKFAKYDENAKSYPFLAESFYKAADIEFCLIFEEENWWSLFPNESLSANRGMDGSGLRSGKNILIQSLQVSNNRIILKDITQIKRKKLKDLKDSISINSKLQNWISFIVYKYIPYGFELLKVLRSIKQAVK